MSGLPKRFEKSWSEWSRGACGFVGEVVDERHGLCGLRSSGMLGEADFCEPKHISGASVGSMPECDPIAFLVDAVSCTALGEPERLVEATCAAMAVLRVALKSARCAPNSVSGCSWISLKLSAVIAGARAAAAAAAAAAICLLLRDCSSASTGIESDVSTPSASIPNPEAARIPYGSSNSSNRFAFPASGESSDPAGDEPEIDDEASSTVAGRGRRRTIAVGGCKLATSPSSFSFSLRHLLLLSISTFYPSNLYVALHQQLHSFHLALSSS